MKHRISRIILIIFLAALLNNGIQFLGEFVFSIPFYFDSIFTIAVGIFFGWIPGALTGLLTNMGMEITHGFHGLSGPFAIINMATGALAGLIAADKEKYWHLPRQIFMILALTTVNVLLGAYIVNILFGGLTGSNPDILIKALLLMGENKVMSTIIARIPINLVDKGLPVLLIYIGYRIYRKRKDREYLPTAL
jgi:hypothetical protein